MTKEDTDKQNYFFQFSFSKNEQDQFFFENENDLVAWLEGEVDFWSWTTTDLPWATQELINSKQRLANAYSKLKATMEKLKNDQLGSLDHVKIALQELVNVGMGHSGEFRNQALYTVYKTYGMTAAVSAHMFRNAQIFNINNKDSYIGIYKYNQIIDGIDSTSVTAAITSFQSAKHESIKKLNNTTNYAKKLVEKAEADLSELERKNKILSKWTKSRWNVFKKEKTQDCDKEIERLIDIQKTYSEYMNISAPVSYWNKKSENHFTAANKKRNFLLGYTALALMSVFGAAYCFWAEMVNFDEYHYVPLALFVFATTIIFWAGRIIVRLYLSELHLGIDAQERSVMAETYLALINDNKVEKEDRNIVLAALFRPTADGIIKDDAAPLLSPSSFLSSRL